MFDMKNISKIKGYKTIPNPDMFSGFLKNFIAGFGIEARETIKPISIKQFKDCSGSYLKFTYEIYGKPQWMHVVGVSTYY